MLLEWRWHNEINSLTGFIEYWTVFNSSQNEHPKTLFWRHRYNFFLCFVYLNYLTIFFFLYYYPFHRGKSGRKRITKSLIQCCGWAKVNKRDQLTISLNMMIIEDYDAQTAWWKKKLILYLCWGWILGLFNGASLSGRIRPGSKLEFA